MSESGRVHRDCVNASNPYHECGVNCLEKIAQGKGRKEKKNLDTHSGIKEGELSRKKDEVRRVHQTCPKAPNPYHECNDSCFKRTAGADAPGVKKESDNHNGIKGELSRKKDEERRAHPTCPKVSNPYHECNDSCVKRIAGADARGVKKESGSKIFDASRSFGRKKKGPESQPKATQVLDNVPVETAVYQADAPSCPFDFPSTKKLESENDESFSSSERYSEEIYPRDNSFSKEHDSYQSAPTSGNVTVSDPHKDPSKNNITRFAGESPTKQEQDKKLHASAEVVSQRHVEDMGKGNTRPVVKSMGFSFSGISRASEESDEEETRSVISDSCVSVGKYHVKASCSSILQTIFDKYGDIAASCQLKSISMRAYYLECVCSVVQELQSTSFMQLTKPKIKELLAVLKDVESAQIDVAWLHGILNEISEAIELISQQQGIEVAKADSDHALESTKQELESQVEDLAQKEKEVADAKARVSKTRACLSELELECSRLEDTLTSIRSKVDKFRRKSQAEKLLL